MEAIVVALTLAAIVAIAEVTQEKRGAAIVSLAAELMLTANSAVVAGCSCSGLGDD